MRGVCRPPGLSCAPAPVEPADLVSDHVPSEGRPGAHPTLAGGGASYIFSVSQTSNTPKVGFYPILYNFLDSIRAKPGHQGADDSC